VSAIAHSSMHGLQSLGILLFILLVSEAHECTREEYTCPDGSSYDCTANPNYDIKIYKVKWFRFPKEEKRLLFNMNPDNDPDGDCKESWVDFLQLMRNISRLGETMAQVQKDADDNKKKEETEQAQQPVPASGPFLCTGGCMLHRVVHPFLFTETVTAPPSRTIDCLGSECLTT